MRQGRRRKSGEGDEREGPVATRKPRAKRFVECFMESFRIVDFLSLRCAGSAGSAASGFMIAAARTNGPVAAATFSAASII